jgi:hypothetical protein
MQQNMHLSNFPGTPAGPSTLQFERERLHLHAFYVAAIQSVVADTIGVSPLAWRHRHEY